MEADGIGDPFNGSPLNSNSDVSSSFYIPKSLPSLRILRVHQLDALYFDEEIVELMSVRLMRVFQFFESDFVERFKPEITALLHSALFYLSIWSSNSTYGQQIQNLVFADARKPVNLRGGYSRFPPTTGQKIMFYLFTVGVTWASDRFFREAGLQNWMELPSSDPRHMMWVGMKRAQNVIKVLKLMNFILFLYNGKFVNLVARLLSIRLIYNRHHQRPRGINFDFLNRQLVWQEFTDFFIFLFQLINLTFIVQIIKRSLSSLSAPFHHVSLLPSSSSSSSSSPSSPPSPLSFCRICNESPIVTPYCGECEHPFCYYCLRVAITEDEGFLCIVCGEKIGKIRPFRAS